MNTGTAVSTGVTDDGRVAISSTYTSGVLYMAMMGRVKQAARADYCNAASSWIVVSSGDAATAFGCTFARRTRYTTDGRYGLSTAAQRLFSSARLMFTMSNTMRSSTGGNGTASAPSCVDGVNIGLP